MKKGQTIHNIKVTTIGFWGVGVWVAENGKKILIKWSVLPHSIIDCVIIKSKKDHILAMPIRVISIEPERSDAKPVCTHYSNPLEVTPDNQIHKNGCWWCKRQLLSYSKQLELKKNLVHDSFRGVSYLLKKTPLQEIIPSPLTYHYRNKIEFSFWKYITKAKNDKKAQAQRNWEVIEKTHSIKESINIDPNLEWINNPDFSHYHNRQLGFHKQWFYTHVIDVDQCYLISEKLHTVYNYIKNLCKDSELPVHDPKTHQWVFRHLVMRQWYNTNQILINLVVSDEQVNTEKLTDLWISFKKKLISDERLRKECTTLLLTYNNTVSDAVKRQDTDSDIIRWEGYIFEELHFHNKYIENFSEQEDKIFTIEDGMAKELPLSENKHSLSTSLSNLTNIRFRISPFSFFQTNTLGAQELFSKAASFISLPKSKQTIMDLYCWAGTIWLSLLSQGIGNFVLGIEIVEDAIKDANYNAKINNLDTHSYFAAGKTEVILKHDPKFIEKMNEVWLVIVDPPREGLHKDVCDFLNNLRKDYKFQLIYISCNPVTLARDLDLLVQWWWDLQVLQPVDMFPQSHHVEMISVLE
jgi:23S rRNA (uracil1939-C5)-methyltransferase